MPVKRYSIIFSILLTTSCLPNNRTIFILNKKTNEIHWEDFVEEKSLGLRLYNYFPHDGDDNRVMFFVRPTEWLYFIKNAKIDDLPSDLKERIESFVIVEDSNPILVFYRER